MFIKVIIGVIIGGLAGAVMGYAGSCTTGACPLTSNPWIGGVYGAFIGGLIASTI
ncbi:hypothetical protein HS125_09470 [bacterium]|nr:hypothetical protein [bacterium]